jgi:hypothetical protein
MEAALVERKRRKPGGGRKPAGPIKGKSSTFSTRITDETRQMLEAEATESGQSISQIAETLLKFGLEARRQRELDDPIQALSHLMSGIAYNCIYINERDKQCEWTNDAFAYDAFARAVVLLLEGLRPKTEIVPPKEIFGMPSNQTSSDLADRAFAQVWRAFKASKPISVAQVASLALRGMFAASLLPEVMAGMSRASYAMDRARRALEFKGDDE